jgi:protein-S-isoprenylcysteine O-methyltransferase Ste14
MEPAPAAAPEALDLRIKNTAASITVAAAATAYYCLVPYYSHWLDHLYGPQAIAFTGYQFMHAAAALYCLALAAVFLRPGATGVSKSLVFFRVLARWIRAPVATFRDGLSREDRLAVLSTFLKSYYGPMMAFGLMQFCTNAWVTAHGLMQQDLALDDFRAVFDSYGFWFMMNFILFWDLLLYTFGYLIESPRLRNQIRSVDPTLLGWTAALACYMPFSFLTVRILGTPREEFPRFEDPTLHYTMNSLLLVFLAIYTSASIALGLKASNLTHRGVVSRGPYAFVRHPAYVAKNAAWWIGAMPIIATQLQHSMFQALVTAGSIVAWSAIYVLRALTEEDHLRSVDGDYDRYAAKVRYRFIPGIV